MKIIFFLLFINILCYSCSPINKQHGYLLDDVLNSTDELSKFAIGTSSENDVFKALGSPSIEISDINNVWIYLISVKQRNVFESDNIVYQSIFRFEFDKNGVLLSKNIANQSDFNEIAFSKSKTRVLRNAYGVGDQLYEAFTRGQ